MSRMKTLFGILFFAAVYFISAKFGLSLAFVHANATAVWPPTGFSLAVLLCFGIRFWPGILIGAFVANMTTQGSIATSVGIAIGNTLEAVIGAWLVNRFAGGKETFSRTATIFRYAVLAALASTGVSATLGVTSLALGGFAPWENYGIIWLTWWLGDMVSNIIFAPLLIIIFSKAKPLFSMEARKFPEAVLVVVISFFISQAVFGGLSPLASYPLGYLCLPPLLWVAFRFGTIGAALIAFLMSSIAVLGTLRGHGAFATHSPNESLLLLQAFMATITLTALVLAAVVSERRRAEEALAKHIRDLARSNSELEQFAYIASHDLQEPLRKIIAFCERLKESHASHFDESDKDYFERMQHAAWRMKQLLEDLLNYSRITSASYVPEEVDLNAVVKDVLHDLEMRIAESKAVVQLEKLPLVYANKLRMNQLFQNLIGNALKFSSRDRVPLIRVGSEDAGDGKVRVWVRDNGIGFDEKYLEKIFKPFQRLHRHEEYEGSGVGLAICQKIAEQHGGSITATSVSGEGSAFFVTLPQKLVGAVRR